MKSTILQCSISDRSSSSAVVYSKKSERPAKVAVSEGKACYNRIKSERAIGVQPTAKLIRLFLEESESKENKMNEIF